MGIDTTIIPVNANAIKADILATVSSDINLLGEIRPFALTIAGALTKSQLQAKGWAICDGTTATAQGISDATIENTPDLRQKFLRHSANETTGGTVTENFLPSHKHNLYQASQYTYISTSDSQSGTGWQNGYVQATTSGTALVGYDICYFIKVKV